MMLLRISLTAAWVPQTRGLIRTSGLMDAARCNLLCFHKSPRESNPNWRRGGCRGYATWYSASLHYMQII